MKKHDALAPSIPAPEAVALVRKRISSEWMRLREENALALFHEAALRVPAYQKFLKEHSIDASKITTWEDFTNVPPTSKADYLRHYPLEELCWDGTLARPAVFAATSGSTGKPFYFQRSQNLEEEYSALVELFMSQGATPPGPDCPTLVIIGFGMGVWIGGMLTYRAYEIASQRGYPVSILPAGVNKDEILNALKELAPQFKQTILIGYPPFVKDVIDEAEAAGIDLPALHLRLQFAAESFTEQFREYLGKKAGIQNVLRDTLNVYGTADIGAMAFETPTAILVRRLSLANEKVFTKLFGATKKMPTLAQYNPAFMTFETNAESDVFLTGNSAIPLIRYAVGDHGGVHSYDEIVAMLAEEGISLENEAKKHDAPLYQLPFVFVYERSDLATTLYGMQIYPQYLRDALLAEEVQRYLTGKFQIETKYSEDQDQFLLLHIELKRDVSELSDEVKEQIRSIVDAALKEKSSEYRELSSQMKGRALFKLAFYELGHPEYFPTAIKQKWVKK